VGLASHLALTRPLPVRCGAAQPTFKTSFQLRADAREDFRGEIALHIGLAVERGRSLGRDSAAADTVRQGLSQRDPQACDPPPTMDRGYPLARKEGPVAEIYLAQKAEVKNRLTVTRPKSLSFAIHNHSFRSLRRDQAAAGSS
jgi:hypothetical protein